MAAVLSTLASGADEPSFVIFSEADALDNLGPSEEQGRV